MAPAELEDQLLKSSIIADAAVVGVTIQDEEWPCAYVVLADSVEAKKTTPRQIQDWFRPRVARHKALVGGVKFVDEIVSLAVCPPKCSMHDLLTVRCSPNYPVARFNARS